MKIVNRNFNVRQIAESGQCFRMNLIDHNRYSLIAFGRYIELTQTDDETVTINCCEEEYRQIWKEYFDLEYDYGRIVETLSNGRDPFLKKASLYGSGIRILRQEPFEMLISFIISQNKNIPSIKYCIERICEAYGEHRTDIDTGVEYYAFPGPQRLARAKKEELRALKLGYRDEYIIRASQAVMDGTIDLYSLKERSHEEAVRSLKGIRGIGEKVANCISLYGLHHIEAFPVDVWIKKVLHEVYQNGFHTEYYEGYAGIVQQYMFYYMRNLDKVSENKA